MNIYKLYFYLKTLTKRVLNKLRFGKITEHVVCTAGDNIAAEIEYKDRRGKVIGFWAYGYFHPDYPYRG